MAGGGCGSLNGSQTRENPADTHADRLMLMCVAKTFQFFFGWQFTVYRLCHLNGRHAICFPLSFTADDSEWMSRNFIHIMTLSTFRTEWIRVYNSILVKISLEILTMYP